MEHWTRTPAPGGRWTDHVHPSGRVMAAQGFSRDAASWSVLIKDPARPSGWRWVGDAPTLAEAKTAGAALV